MPTPYRPFLLAAMTMLGAGCAVGPEYQAPAVEAPNRFNNLAGLDQGDASSPTDLASWWESFQDPLLSKLVAQSVKDNLDLAQTVARVTQSRALLRASTAALLPSGGVDGQAARAHQSLQTPLGRVLDASSPGFDRDGSYYELNIGTSWEIDLFGGRRRAREAALAELQATEAGLAAAQLSVATQTADTYFVIRGIQDRLAIAQEQLHTQQRLVDTVKLQFEAGVVAELPLRQAEGALSMVEAAVPALKAALESALNALDVALGTQPGTHHAELGATGAVIQIPSIGEIGGPVDLLRRRPDLMAAERRLVASNARIGVAIAEYYPQFSFSGLVGTATTLSGNMFDGDASQAQAVLGLRWRLFDFGRIDAEIAASRGRNAEALAAYRLAALRASEDVENSLAALIRSEAQSRTLLKGEQSLAKAREAAMAAYEGGVVSLVEVLDADTRLLATRDSKAQARTEAARATVATFKALGGGWMSKSLEASGPASP